MDFLVDKQHLDQIESAPSPPLVLSEGDILIRIEKFAFTANNVSYAATGEALGYWNFFPTSSPEKGRIPVWGVGVIVASRCPSLTTHRRVYGYFPMSTLVVLHPVQVTHADFIDGMEHRRNLPALYNQYLLCDEDPFYSPRTEDAMMVLRPLFFTSWLLLDFFRHHRNQHSPFFGANTMVLSSASSKTSIGLAFLMHQYKQENDNHNFRIIGLTSARNVALVQSLGIYDEIITYDRLEEQLPKTPSIFVDMAGNTQVTTRLHRCLGDHFLKYSCLVGAAHVGQGGKPKQPLPGAKPKFFFAPAWTALRIQELGGSRSGNDAVGKRKGLQLLLHQVLLDYQKFVNWCLGSSIHPHLGNGTQWLHMRHFRGAAGVKEGYRECLEGNIEPNAAVIMSLWPEKEAQEWGCSKL